MGPGPPRSSDGFRIVTARTQASPTQERFGRGRRLVEGPDVGSGLKCLRRRLAATRRRRWVVSGPVSWRANHKRARGLRGPCERRAQSG